MKPRTIAAIAALALAGMPAWAVETPQPCDVEVPAVIAEPAASESIAGFGAAVPAEALEAHRGGADLHVTEMRVRGTLQENAAYNLETGSNFITSGAFTNASGLPMTIQNSGNNVLIQNSTIINLESR